MEKYLISKELLTIILNNLGNRPFNEVSSIINRISEEVRSQEDKPKDGE